MDSKPENTSSTEIQLTAAQEQKYKEVLRYSQKANNCDNFRVLWLDSNVDSALNMVY